MKINGVGWVAANKTTGEIAGVLDGGSVVFRDNKEDVQYEIDHYKWDDYHPVKIQLVPVG